MKATATASANIAFIKYWGKSDPVLRLPCNDSISMNLSSATTTTTVDFSPNYNTDEVYYGNQKMDARETKRVIEHLDRIRQLAKEKLFAKVVTQNSFPKGAGIASSASGFAALTLAAITALGLKLSERELSVLARLGSGSACRSMPSGFAEWKSADTSDSSYAYSLYGEKYWDLRDIIVVVSEEKKNITSSAGHENAKSSIFFQSRLANLPQRIKKLKEALKAKDMKTFGNLAEEEAIELHAIMMTQKPPLFYWTGATVDIINKVHQWRDEGMQVYFTIDAGPNVHLICEAKEEKKVLERLNGFPDIKNVIINTPAVGAKVVDKHLF